MNKKRILDIGLIIILLFIVISNVMSKTLGNLDELWNYNFARNMADGLIPYKDFNMVTTPLLPMISAVFLKIFGNELIIMRLVETILITTIFFMCYKILELLTKDRKISIIATLIVTYIFNQILSMDYNYANLLIALIITFIELKNTKEKTLIYEPKKDLIIGIIAGVTILFKQTTGICIALATIGYKILAVRSKEEFKEFIKIAAIRIAGVIIPVVFLIIYLAVNGALKDFVDYAIMGIGTFENKIPYKIFYKRQKVLAIVIPIALIIMFIKSIRNKDNKILILFAYAVSTFVVAFPITDEVHFKVGSLITIIGIAYMLNQVYLKCAEKNKMISQILYSIICGVVVGLCIYRISNCMPNMKQWVLGEKETELQHFYGIMEDKEMKTAICKVGDVIKEKRAQGKNVYILDAEAALYMIPLDTYNKDYDMLLKGNIGVKDEQGIVERIKTEENAVYLIRKSKYLKNWQHPQQVTDYVEKNFEKSGEVHIFDIYEREIRGN